MNIALDNKRITGTIEAVEYTPLVHRYLICQALTDDHEPLSCTNLTRELRATVNCLKELELENGVEHIGEKEIHYLNCGDSENTFRLLMPIAAALGKNCEVTASRNLMEQPIEAFLKSMKVHGIRHEFLDARNMRIWGQLTAGTYILPATISTQFVSGLLYALPLLKENSVIMIDGELTDQKEINMTLETLKMSGIQIDVQMNPNRPQAESRGGFIGASFRIRGKQKYNLKKRPLIEGDWSIAAYFLAAGAVCGGPVAIKGLNMNSCQHCRQIVNVLEKAGVSIEYGIENTETEGKNIFKSFMTKNIGGILYGISAADATYIKVTGPWSDPENISQFFQRERLKAFEIDAEKMRNVIPAIALIAAASRGTSCIRNACGKENEFQIEKLIQVLETLGVMIWEAEGDLFIEGYNGAEPLSGGRVSTFADGYIAMMEGIASCVSSSHVTIEKSEIIEKIYPKFFEKLYSMQSR